MRFPAASGRCWKPDGARFMRQQYPGLVVLDEIWKPLDGYHLLAPLELAERILAAGRSHRCYSAASRLPALRLSW